MTLATLTFYDAAWPPDPPPPTDGVCIYLGGDTPHPWLAAEIAAQTARWRLPVWVRSNPQAVSPASDATACLGRLKAVGAPKGTLVALDSETSVDPAWVQTFVGLLNAGGYPVIDYGSESTLRGNDNPDGYYWGADWTSVPHLHSGEQMTQYVSFAAYDESLAQASLPFWDTRPPAPVQTTEADLKLTTVRKGDTSQAVRNWQAMLVSHGYGYLIAIPDGKTVEERAGVDGVFGDRTDTATRKFQSDRFGPAGTDGIVGPQTWTAALA